MRSFHSSKIFTSLVFLFLGNLCIGGHQVLEYFAISTQLQIIYKIGLMFSISSMYFNFRALDHILEKSINSRVCLVILVLLGLYLFLGKQMSFQNTHFYVRGEDHFFWGALWMLFFLYWNCNYLYFYYKVENKKLKKFLLYSPTYSLNISFMLAASYSYIAGVVKNYLTIDNPGIGQLCGGILSNFEIVFDAPSIWCVFASFQGYFLYRLGKQSTDISDNDLKEIKTIKEPYLICLGLALFGVFVIFLTLPIFSSLSYKMIVK